MIVGARADRICEWTGGSLLAGRADRLARGTAIDSRAVGPEELFVAIVGPNHDAHRFVPEVLARGVAGVLVQHGRGDETLVPGEAFVIAVEDTTRALADLGRGHRQGYGGPLIGITGSNGKTTTKELCTAILERVGPTLATRGNLNNNFGVPLTLLRRREEDVFAVVEMGMNHRHEIESLCRIAQPTIGILTNVGTAHIENLGSREAIAEEKGDLLAALPASGTAVVGRDDPLAYAQAKRSAARILSFGRSPQAELKASGIRFLAEGAFAFRLETPFGGGEIRVPGLAETMVENALAAAGGALAAGAAFEAVAEGLARYAGVPGRMQPRTLRGGLLALDDTYNANPQSMTAALETLARLEQQGRRLAVLGRMGELGEHADAAHRALGRLAAELAIDELFVLGSAAAQIAEGAREAGMGAERVHFDETASALAARLARTAAAGDRILFKGSRSARVEEVIEALEEVVR
ncbi:MAG: UDP-N-acetylmuramoyl-tripeptide--D-alanyl-D-alanine ligase [Myxococcota bacterium]